MSFNETAWLSGRGRVDLKFPGDTGFPFIAGQWRREGDYIIGSFTRPELEFCMRCGYEWELPPHVERPAGIAPLPANDETDEI